MPIEPGFVALRDDEFIDEARKVVEAAQQKGTVLRELGSLAIYVHSLHNPECSEFLHRVGRVKEGVPLFTDLDLMGYASQSRAISKVFDGLEFRPDKMVNGFFGDRRLIYYEKNNRFHVDIFLDKLEFSHDVLFGKKPGNGRLELDYPTITVTDLVLEKLQIHNISRKDLVDLIVLFLGHAIDATASGDRESIHAGYIANLLADDWGFWYESIQNLRKTRELLETFAANGRISVDHAARIQDRMRQLEATLTSIPKSRQWEKRAKIGTAKPWFREVEEVVR
jgi:hypothetical protein